MVDRLAASLQKALQDETVKTRFASLERRRWLRTGRGRGARGEAQGMEIDRWRPVIEGQPGNMPTEHCRGATAWRRCPFEVCVQRINHRDLLLGAVSR